MSTLAPPTVSPQETRTLAERLKELSDLAPAPARTPAASEDALAAIAAQVSDLHAQLTELAPTGTAREDQIAALSMQVAELSAQLAEVKALVAGLARDLRTVVEDSALQVVGALLPAQRQE